MSYYSAQSQLKLQQQQLSEEKTKKRGKIKIKYSRRERKTNVFNSAVAVCFIVLTEHAHKFRLN